MSCALVTGHTSAAFGKHSVSCRQCTGLKKKGFFLRPKFRRLRSLQVSAQGMNSEWEREESRWRREEERWRREEQRWLREEQRWNAEAARMKEEIVSLRKEIETLRQVPEKHESSNTLRDVLLGLKGLLQSLNSSESGTEETKPPVELPKTEQSVESIKFILPDPPKPETTPSKPVASKKKIKGTSSKQAEQQRTLQRGAEGEDVRMLQEALAELGFYCGEDDMEYSSFSSATDRAVKSWQASIGAPENGMVTAQVFAQLVSGQGVVINSSAVLKTPETPSSVSETRVYLLGENRWEDPNRLLKRNQKTTSTAQQCLTCKGEGRSLCSECEGTGELNVEEQFLEWAGEGAKCPYCEGSGTVICDVCDGKGVADQ